MLTGKGRVRPTADSIMAGSNTPGYSMSMLNPISRNDHGARMGLFHRTSRMQGDFAYDLRKDEVTHFIKSNFKMKECIRFIPANSEEAEKNGETAKCHCGALATHHIKGSGGITDYYQHGARLSEKQLEMGEVGEWLAGKDIREMATDAFGKINFINEGLGGRKPAKFVRLKDDTPPNLVIDLMMDYWNMMKPFPANLVITVIGGAKNFRLDGKKKEVFNRGLIKAAQTTHAWIITSGCNMGVMKAVGEAVQEGQSYQWDRYKMTHSLRCIGIAPWGYVERKEVLISVDGHGSWNAKYKASNIIRHGHPVSLNPDHTHFFLIDDGHRGRYDGVAEFRAQLERKISLPRVSDNGGETGLGIPVVLVVVEGGYDAILDTQKSLSAKIPVVICEGTGRAADIIAYAYNHYATRKGERTLNVKHKSVLEDKLIEAYGKRWKDKEAEAKRFLKIVMECCEDEKLITVFDMNKHHDLDHSILSALLKGQGATNWSQLRDQLKLALTWDRSDIAEEKIFNDTVNWPPGSLDDIMTTALLDDKVNFVRLLLQNGVVMREYLTVARLRKLYNSAPKLSNLRKLLKRDGRLPDFTLLDVSKLLRKLFGRFDDSLYQLDNDLKSIMKDEDSGPDDCFQKPFMDLFLWAVLMNRQEMAKFMWERGDEALPMAIAATCIYDSLADKVAHYDSDLKNMYVRHKDEFEMLAVKLLDECQATDPEKADMLIERPYSSWGDRNCLEMAASAADREFLSTVCCQNSLNMMWKKGIASGWAKILLGLLFPPIVCCFVRFQPTADGCDELGPFEKLFIFFRAPVVKFWSNVMMYLIFLLFYSHVILFEFRPEITIPEWILIAWVFTLLIEELRELFFSSNADSLRERIMSWWHFSVFNRIDLIVLVLAVLGFVLRFINGYFVGAKTVYCINCVFLFIRGLSYYSASSNLGPKLVMISKMVKELALYITILLVFLLAYGISTQALRYPIREFYWLIIRDIFYYPYWQIYGELYLEEIEGRTDDCIGNGTVQSDGMPCPEYSWLVPVLTAAYLLIGNVLLLNLLIAIFTHVFEEVQTNSIQIWKYGIYFLVVEYENKPSLAPPFIIFEHIFLIFKWLGRRTCCQKKDAGSLFPMHTLELLKVFEKEMLRSFLRHRQQVQRNAVDVQVTMSRIMTRVEEMAKLVEEDRLLEQQHYEAVQKNGHAGLSPRSLARRAPVTSQDTLDETLASALTPTIQVQPPRRRFSRWPSLSKIKQLKEELESIQEGPSGTDNENALQSGRTSPASWSNINVGASTSNAADDHDHSYYDKIRPRPNDPNFAPNNLEPTPKAWDSKQHISSVSKHQAPPSQMMYPDVEFSHVAMASESEEETKVKRKQKKKKKRSRKGKKYELEEISERDDGRFHQLENYDSVDDCDLPYHLRRKKSHRRKTHTYSSGSEHAEQKQLNIVSSEEEGHGKLGIVEDRLVQLEESTSQKLYNIEALLRSAVFYQGALRNVRQNTTPHQNKNPFM